MFLLIAFVLGNNYCIETTSGRCENLCKNKPEFFDEIFSHIPKDSELNANNNEIHNFYIADDVLYLDSIHYFIFCDPSIHLIYEKPLSSIKISDHTYINSSEVLLDAPILFKIERNINIDVDTEKKIDSKQVILEATKSVEVLTRFYVENFPENLISISPSSSPIQVIDKRESILKVYNDTDKLILRYDISYYCISDKDQKCSGFNYPSMKYVDSVSDIIDNSAYVIIDTTVPQNIISTNLHIIAMAGSDIFYNPFIRRELEFYVILHSNSIEMYKMFIEGEGKVRYATNYYNISVHSTTKKCSIDFHLQSSDYYDFRGTCIYPLKNDFEINLDKKIHIRDYSLFRGPGYLSGMFEPEKYLKLEEFFYDNITSDQLKEYDYIDLDYYLQPGNFEIPTTWKKTSRFHGLKPKETNIIFNDVYVFDGYFVDNFITCNRWDNMEERNYIIVRPARYFYLNGFEREDEYLNHSKYTIEIDKDVFMLDKKSIYDSPEYNYSELRRDQCKIIGKGNLLFDSPGYLDFIQNVCQIDENVHLVNVTSKIPTIYACIGQSNIDKCVAEIEKKDSSKDYEWLWFRNIATVDFLQEYMNIEKVYLTDKSEFSNSDHFYDIKCDLILTANADVMIDETAFSIYSDHINNVYAENSKAKLTYYFYYNSEISIFYHEAPTNIDFSIAFKSDTQLRMKYISDYVPHSIKLKGECNILIRDYLRPKTDIFQKPDTIKFVMNYETNYNQVLYSDVPIEHDDLTDFILCNTYEKFIECINYSRIWHIFICKDIQIDFSCDISYRNNPTFYFYNNVKVNIEVSNDALIYLYNSRLKVAYHTSKYFYLINNNIANKFVFNIKDSVYLHIDYNLTATTIPIIEFAGTKHSVEILIDQYIKDYKNEYEIKVHGDLSFVSPTPQYLIGILDSNSINFSPNWSYLYISEKGKEFYKSNPYESFNILDNNANLLSNVVVAVGKDDLFTIPDEWNENYNIYLLQDDVLYIEKLTNILCEDGYLLLNNKFKIVMGNATIYVPNSFSLYLKSDFYSRYEFSYNVTLDCSKNSHTNLYVSYVDYTFYDFIIKVNGYNLNQRLTIQAQTYGKYICINKVLDFYYDSGYKYTFNYDSSCFYKYRYDVVNLCPQNSFSSMYEDEINFALSMIPELPIYIGSDFQIYYYPKDHVHIYPTRNNIKLTFPDLPKSLLIFEDKVIQLGYPDSSLFDIENGTININFAVNESFELDIRNSVQSTIILKLTSDVFIRPKSKITSKVNFLVINNSYHLYTEDIDMVGDIFGDSLEEYVKKCAHDKDSAPYCLYNNKDLIENVFNNPIYFQELEIVLITTPKEIKLPSISKFMNVNISTISLQSLSIKEVMNIKITSEVVAVNDYWLFAGNRKTLILKLEANSTLFINEQITEPVTLQLTNAESYINLLNCDEQKISKITILKYGSDTNKLTIYGSYEMVNNFIHSLVKYDGINVIYKDTKRYHCICNNNEKCDKCKLGINGIISTSNNFISDPGENVTLRIFSEIEASSNAFTNEHNVLIDDSAALNLTDVVTIDQNLENGIKIDKLWFTNSGRILLKPKPIELKIVSKKDNEGPNLFIEVNQYLKLNATNINDEKIKPSNLYISGIGELNVNNYPIEKIKNVDSVKLFKGVYLICNDSQCSFNSNYGYDIIALYNNFKNIFDEFTKIIVFLNSFANNIDANLNDLNGQKIEFAENSQTSSTASLFEKQNKLRFTTTTELINKADSTIKLSSPNGGALIDDSDSDLFIVGFESNLTIKQEENSPSNIKKITIQPMNEDVTIFIDESVDIEKQKIKIQTEEEKKIKVKVVSNKNIPNEEILNKFIENDDDKVTFVFEDPIPTNPKNNGFPIGAIIGIVVGAVVIIAVIIIVIFVMKKKKQNEMSTESNDSINQFDDSTF